MSDTLSLINANNGIIYDVSKTVMENGILNGTKLILI